jgi:hypothetical protein
MSRLDHLALILCVAAFALPSVASAGEEASAPFGFRGYEIYKLERGIFGLCAADLDGDGRRDLVFVNNAKARLDVFLRRAEEVAPEAKIGEVGPNEIKQDRFYERRKLLTETTVSSLSLGDVNGDRKVDVVYYGKPYHLVVAFGDGKGGFGERRRIEIRDGAPLRGGLDVGDLNGDGRDDVVLQKKAATVILFQGEDGKLAAPVELPSSGKGVVAVGIDDLDGDGRGDLVQVAPREARSFRVRYQREDGRLGPEVAFELPPLRALEMTKLDPRPGSEVVVIQQSSGLVRALGLARREPGAGTGIPLGEIRLHPFPETKGGRKRTMAVGDVSGDGRVDVVVTEPASAQVAVYLQTPDGRIGAPRLFPSLAESDDVRVADLLGDERREIAVLSRKEKAIGLGALDADGRLPFPSLLPVPGAPQAFDTGDLDGDGKTDLVVLTKHEKAWQAVVLGRGEDGLTIGRAFELEGLDERKDRPEDLLLTDLDRDGRTDLLVLDGYRPIRVYRQGEDGTFTYESGKPGFRGGLVDKKSLQDAAVVDLDGDGKPELLVSSKGFARALVMEKDGTLRITEQVNARTPASLIKGMAAVDLNGDGQPEVALLDGKENAVTILTRGEDGVYQVAASFGIGDFSYERLIARDANGDGRPDLVVLGADRFGVMAAGATDDHLEELHVFESPIRKSSLADIATGDLNGDGRTDLALVDVGNAMIELLSYDPKTGFRHELKWRVFEEKMHRGRGGRGEPREILVEDLDGDGKDDIALIVHDRIIVYPQG